MVNSIWVVQAIFFLGFFHGLQGDHLISVLNSGRERDIYERHSWISFKLGLMHLVYALGFIIPLWLLKRVIPGLAHLPSHFLPGCFFMALGLHSFYEFFWTTPKRLHQHEHVHEHDHGHLHQMEAAEGKEHVDHFHLPHDIDKHEATVLDPSEHQHLHDHHHEHLHFHAQESGRNHRHQHYLGLIKRLGTLQNLLLLLAVSMTAIVFSLPGVLLSLAVFLCGLFLAIYLLGVLYRGRGINLMGKINHFSTLFLGVIEGLTGFWLLW